MVNVRIAQIGQTAVNRPFFEVQVDAVSYVFATEADGRVMAKTSKFLKNLGVYSCVTDRFQDAPNANVAKALKLASDYSTTKDGRFPSVTLGSGLAFVSDFKTDCGWVNLFPANRFVAIM